MFIQSSHGKSKSCPEEISGIVSETEFGFVKNAYPTPAQTRYFLGQPRVHKHPCTEGAGPLTLKVTNSLAGRWPILFHNPKRWFGQIHHISQNESLLPGHCLRFGVQKFRNRNAVDQSIAVEPVVAEKFGDFGKILAIARGYSWDDKIARALQKGYRFQFRQFCMDLGPHWESPSAGGTAHHGGSQYRNFRVSPH